MALGLFDVIGPVMHGPSSNHTAGANRIGWLAQQLMGGTPAQLVFGFHPVLHQIYRGHRTHVALLAGCLGMREFDSQANQSLGIAASRGIAWQAVALDAQVDRNAMEVRGRIGSVEYCIHAISVGGGNVQITNINGVETNLRGDGWLLLCLLGPGAAWQRAQSALADMPHCRKVFGGEGVFGAEWDRAPSLQEQSQVEQLLGEGLLCSRLVEPLTEFSPRGENVPYFKTFAQWLERARQDGLLESVLEYERRRSQATTRQILGQAGGIVDVIEQSMERGLRGHNPLIAGLCTGNDGRRMADWAQSGCSLTGEILPMAMARALAMAEISASGGRVVAVPTAGAAGTLPGVLFTVAQRVGAHRERLAQAFLIAAAIGCVVGNHCCFSGSTGGCQAEIGIGSAMAAGAAAWLGGGSDESVMHGAALAMKNTLGLTCDPPAPPVEVPCIKRNALGASVALMAAEMALAGIRSVVTPDDVVLALADVQRRMPPELRCTCIGGLAAAPGAPELQKKWHDRLAQLGETE